MNRTKIFLLTCLCSLWMIGAGAQVLTLEEAINIALRNSLDIQIARNNVEASGINNHISIAGGLPVVTGSLTDNQSITNLNQELTNGQKIQRRGNVQNQLNAGVTGNYTLFNGFRIQATRQRLEALENQSEHQLSLQIQNIISDVMVRYYDIVRQQGFMETIRQSIEVTRQRKELMDVRQSVGLANNADTYQAQLDLVASQQELRAQELVLNQAKADLMNLLAQRPDSNYLVRDTIVVDSTIMMATVVDAISTNPELRSAEEQVRINEFLAREVGALRYPSVGVSAGYNYSRSQSSAGFTLLNQNTGPFVGLNVQVPIFNGGANRRRLRVAEIDTRNANLQREVVVNNLETLAVRAYQSYQNTLERLRIERENNQVAAALLNVVTQRFQHGVGTVIDLREAQRSFIEAGYRLVNLSYSAKVAEIELKRISSQLGR
ncbi:TolC family protein [Aridibaculum aurantiacum]|uniref:TolC family protein n=1 Tax=Aridibaculum aurantiacum TaxID=2810307 RepID=UPI001F61D8FB|nr:TolC family protein [Aridibaculum aurantiacum]